MPDKIVKFWKKFDFSLRPYVHPEDRLCFELSSFQPIEDFESNFRNHFQLASVDKAELNFNIFPEPYTGDLTNSKIVIAHLNPGIGATNFLTEKNGIIDAAVKANIRQAFNETEFPFYYLNPNLCWHGGFVWWERKLKPITQQAAIQLYKGDYWEALKYVSRNISAIELVPYHSAIFREKSYPLKVGMSVFDLASVRHIREFLVRIARQKTVIITRRANEWLDNEQSKHNVIVYPTTHARSANFSKNSSGYEPIMRALGLKISRLQ